MFARESTFDIVGSDNDRVWGSWSFAGAEGLTPLCPVILSYKTPLEEYTYEYLEDRGD